MEKHYTKQNMTWGVWKIRQQQTVLDSRGLGMWALALFSSTSRLRGRGVPLLKGSDRPWGAGRATSILGQRSGRQPVMGTGAELGRVSSTKSGLASYLWQSCEKPRIQTRFTELCEGKCGWLSAIHVIARDVCQHEDMLAGMLAS